MNETTATVSVIEETTLTPVEETTAQVQQTDIIIDYDDSEILEKLEELESIKAQVEQIQTGVNNTSELLYVQTNDISVIKGCVLFVLAFAVIVWVYKLFKIFF